MSVSFLIYKSIQKGQSIMKASFTMNNKNYNFSSSGLFVVLLTILFIALKLLNKIRWSWWWVLSPIWISACIVLLIFIAVVLFYLFFNRKG